MVIECIFVKKTFHMIGIGLDCFQVESSACGNRKVDTIYAFIESN